MKTTLLALLAVGSACATTHPSLPTLPPRTAPLAEREAAAEALLPITPVALPQQYGGSAPYGLGTSFLLLGNGERVSDPLDLIPLAGNDSATAKFARAAEEKRIASMVALGVGLGFETGGLALMVGSLGSIGSSSTSSGPPLPALTTGLLIAGVVTALAALVPIIIGLPLALDQMVEQQSAFAMYPRDLRKQLDLPLPAQPPSAALLPIP